jgi:dinuclear metal center YbgI/SA1388 family protein
VIKLIENGITVLSFHTRLDKVANGVNDKLCEILGIMDAVPFGEGDLGRVGYIPAERLLDDFAYHVKETLDADMVLMADALNPVRRVAVVGGDGKSYVKDAIACGADTYISGRIGYNVMEEAAEMGINLIEAGHYFTEQPILEYLRDLLIGYDPSLSIEIATSNQIRKI